jgi:hypothetical protein
MNHARQDGFAGATLAAEQNRRVAARSALGDFEHRSHGRRSAVETNLGCGFAQPSLEIDQAQLQLSALNALFDDPADLRRFERLGEIIASAAPDRFHCGVDGRVGGHDHQDQAAVRRQKFGDEIESIAGSKAKIEKCEIVGLLRHQCQRVVGSADRRNLATELFETKRKRGANIFFVVDDEHAEFCVEGRNRSSHDDRLIGGTMLPAVSRCKRVGLVDKLEFTAQPVVLGLNQARVKDAISFGPREGRQLMAVTTVLHDMPHRPVAD